MAEFRYERGSPEMQVEVLQLYDNFTSIISDSGLEKDRAVAGNLENYDAVLGTACQSLLTALIEISKTRGKEYAYEVAGRLRKLLTDYEASLGFKFIEQDFFIVMYAAIEQQSLPIILPEV